MKEKIFIVAGTLLMSAALLLTLNDSRRLAGNETTPSEPAAATESAAPETPAPAEATETALPETENQPEMETVGVILPEGAVITDYTDAENWMVWEDNGDKPADLFFVAPTTDMGKDGNYNMVINEKWKGRLLGTYNMEKGIYTDVCNVYAPYYQQATFPNYAMDSEESAPYFALAYADVKSAFAYYLEHCDPDRPLILAGFSQGSEHILSLMKEYFDDEALQDRLVAAYCIGWNVTEEDLTTYPWLKMAQSAEDVGTIIAFECEAEGVTGSPIIPEGVYTYGINPLNWMPDSTPADASLNLGACFTDYDGNVKEEIPNLTGAYRDEKRGSLIVPDVTPEQYPGNIFPDGIYHVYDYQFFYQNLRQNVALRLEKYLA